MRFKPCIRLSVIGAQTRACSSVLAQFCRHIFAIRFQQVGAVSSIALNDMGLPAEVAEFPEPPAGERYKIIIDKEIFSLWGRHP